MSAPAPATSESAQSGRQLSLAEAMETYIRLQHRLSVLRLLMRYLDPFLEQDDGEPIQRHIDRTCFQPEVSPGAFLEILAVLKDLEEEVMKQIDRLSGMSVGLPED